MIQIKNKVGESSLQTLSKIQDELKHSVYHAYARTFVKHIENIIVSRPSCENEISFYFKQIDIIPHRPSDSLYPYFNKIIETALFEVDVEIHNDFINLFLDDEVFRHSFSTEYSLLPDIHFNKPIKTCFSQSLKTKMHYVIDEMVYCAKKSDVITLLIPNDAKFEEHFHNFVCNNDNIIYQGGR